MHLILKSAALLFLFIQSAPPIEAALTYANITSDAEWPF
jgi:hypothetical protein